MIGGKCCCLQKKREFLYRKIIIFAFSFQILAKLVVQTHFPVDFLSARKSDFRYVHDLSLDNFFPLQTLTTG